MFVSLVSLRRRRGALTVDIAEAATALDSLGTGNIVFATLVDDPANVRDTVDAFTGEIMLEAASAADVVNAGLTYVTAIVEETTAVAAQDGSTPQVFAADLTEAAVATDALDAETGAEARDAMLPGVFVNSDGTPREANANGIMVNL